MKKNSIKIVVSIFLVAMLTVQPTYAMRCNSKTLKTFKAVAPVVGVLGAFFLGNMVLDWYHYTYGNNLHSDDSSKEKTAVEIEMNFEELNNDNESSVKNNIFCMHKNCKLTMLGKVDNTIVATLIVNLQNITQLNTDYEITIESMSEQYAQDLSQAFSTIYALKPEIGLTVTARKNLSEIFKKQQDSLVFMSCPFSVNAKKLF